MSQALIQALQNPELYDHSVESFTLIETHISWVLLTGQYAYKIKKPMNFGFLDFSDLDKRKHFCAEELRLNKRLAPELYVKVIPISGSETNPLLGDAAAPIEYAIQMKQFPTDQQLEQLLERNQLNFSHINEVATVVAQFHQQIGISNNDTNFGTLQQVIEPVRQNFEQIKPLLNEQLDLEELNRIECWAEETFNRLSPVFEQRKNAGMIRECHGDLHLGNITLIENNITLFDCIEFNESFRWIDTISEIAFFAMDLESRGLHHFASHFVNSYLEQTGDYNGLQLLDFYKSYRALVRAKVSLFMLQQEQPNSPAAAKLIEQYRSYINLAQSYMEMPNRYLLLMHGYSGTGKTTVSTEIVNELGLVRLRSDVVRKRLFATPENKQQLTNNDIYSPKASELTFNYIADTATTILNAGRSLVIDATFLQQPHRAQFKTLAEKLAVPLHIIDCQLEYELVKQRLQHRSIEGVDVSDADLKIYEMQVTHAEPLNAEELKYSLTVDCSNAENISTLVQTLKLAVSA